MSHYSSGYDTYSSALLPDLNFGEYEIVRVSPKYLLLCTKEGSWYGQSYNLEKEEFVTLPKELSAIRSKLGADYQIIVIKSEEDPTLRDLASLKWQNKFVGTVYDSYSIFWSLKRGNSQQQEVHEHILEYVREKAKKVQREAAKQKRLADKVEANRLGITVSELRFRRKSAKVDQVNEVVRARLTAELSRSMNICDAMRKTISQLEKTCEKLETADWNELQVRWDDKLKEQLQAVEKLLPKVSKLKSERKNK